MITKEFDFMGKLTQIYEELKEEVNRGLAPASKQMNMQSTRDLQQAPKTLAWRNMAVKEAEKLSNDCARKIILDIYCSILPLDSDFVTGNQGLMKSDIDSFLTSKGMNATEYLKSCYEKTNAPLLEFIIRSCDNIRKQFMEDANEKWKDAQLNNIDIPPPRANPDSEDIEHQLVDVKRDMEYEDFIQSLKKKTVNKIVSSVSKVISDRKDIEDMKFKPSVKPEMDSTVTIVIEHIHEKMWKDNIKLTPEQNEEIIGLAIRESTLNHIDLCFKQPDSELIPFRSKIRFSKGVLVTEATIRALSANAASVKKKEPRDLTLETVRSIGLISDIITEVGSRFDKYYNESAAQSSIKKVSRDDVTNKYFVDWFFKVGDWAGIDPKQFPFEEITCGDDFYVFGYFDNNKIEGIIRIDYYDDSYVISFFAVNKRYQSQGIGQYLLQFVLDHFDDKKIVLYVYKDNESAIHIYKKYGFKITGVDKGRGYDPESPHYIMIKDAHE